MKLNKSSIFALMTLGGLMAFGPLASADDQAPATPPPSTPAPDAPPPDAPPGGRRGNRANMEKILEQLKLSDDQKEKVKPILKDQATQMKTLRDDQSLTPQDRRPKMKEIRDATNAKLKTIFTADQYAQWLKLTPGPGRGRRNAGNPPPADAPATPPSAPPAGGNN